jgi:hypothetical protein
VIQDNALMDVQPAEADVAEVDGPDIVVGFLETDELAAEQVGDVDPGAGPADSAVGRDFADLEVSRVLGCVQFRGEGTDRGLVG